jgi:tetratricopeptide (TPR) repeat protein/TolB-like protein
MTRQSLTLLLALALGAAWPQDGVRAEKQPIRGSANSPLVERPLKITVIDFQQSGGDPSYHSLGRSLPEAIAMVLVGDNRVEMVERGALWNHAMRVFEMDKLRDNPELVLDRRVLKEAGIDLVLSGQFLEYRGKVRIDATLEDLRSGKTRELTSETSDVREIHESLKRVSKNLSAQIAALGAPKGTKKLSVSCFWDASQDNSKQSNSLREDLSFSVMTELDGLPGFAILPRTSAPTPCERQQSEAAYAEDVQADVVISGVFEPTPQALRITPRIYIREPRFAVSLPPVFGKRNEPARLVQRIGRDLAAVFGAILVSDRWDFTALSFTSKTPDGYLSEARRYLAAPPKPSLAALMVTRALNLAPDSAEALFLLGKVNRQQEQSDEAVVALRRAVTKMPTKREAWIELAGAYTDLGDYTPAVEALRKAIEISDSPSVRLQLADTLLLARQTALAEQEVRGLLSTMPANAQAYLLLARVHQAAGKLDDAIVELKQATSFDASVNADSILRDIYYARARRFTSQDNSKDALADFLAAKSLRPTADVYGWITYHYNLLKQYDKTIGIAEEAKREKLVSDAVYNNVGFALRNLDRLEEALRAYDEGVQLDSRNFTLVSNRIRLLITMKRYPQALESVDAAMAVSPKAFALHVARGDVLRHFFRYEEARKEFEQAAKLDPGNINARIQSAGAYSDQRQFQEGLDAIEDILKTEPSNRLARNNKAFVLVELGRYTEAIANADAVLASFPEFSNPYNHKGFAQFRLGDRDAGVQNIQRAVSLDSKYAGSYFNLARIYALEGNKDRALENLRKAIDLDNTYASRAHGEPDLAKLADVAEYRDLLKVVYTAQGSK